MKKILLSLVFCTVVALGNSYAQGLKSKVKFDKETIDFGTTKLNKPATVEFVFKNTGTTPLVIENARPSCGCTTPSYTQEPVLPGKEGTITATYNAAVAGSVSKTVAVKFKGIDEELDLHITGKVE